MSPAFFSTSFTSMFPDEENSAELISRFQRNLGGIQQQHPPRIKIAFELTFIN